MLSPAGITVDNTTGNATVTNDILSAAPGTTQNSAAASNLQLICADVKTGPQQSGAVMVAAADSQAGPASTAAASTNVNINSQVTAGSVSSVDGTNADVSSSNATGVCWKQQGCTYIRGLAFDVTGEAWLNNRTCTCNCCL